MKIDGVGTFYSTSASGRSGSTPILAVVKIQKIYPVKRDEPFFGFQKEFCPLKDAVVKPGDDWFIEPVGDGTDDPEGSLGKVNFTVTNVSSSEEVTLRADVTGDHLPYLDFKYGIADNERGGEVITSMRSLTNGTTIKLSKGHLAAIAFKNQLHHVIFNCEKVSDEDGQLLGLAVF